jgi:hypothetical protein
MTRFLRTALLCSAYLIPVGFPLAGAVAQDVVTPAPDPVIGAAPAGPSGAQDSHDEVAIQQLMKIVELSKLIGGGVSQLFGATQTQTQALGAIRDAQIGTKTFPVHNDPDEVTGRQGGAGLKEMATGALNGAAVGPQALIDALTAFRTDYRLDKAFALQNDPSFSKAMTARAAAQGAIAASTAEDSYKRADVSMTRLENYIGALQNSADLKTSMDINARVSIELAQQLNESLRTQAAIASMAGTYFMIIGAESGKDDFLSGLTKFNR